MGTLQLFIDPLRIGLMVLAVATFVLIVRWTLRRSQEQIDADAHLWKEE